MTQLKKDTFVCIDCEATGLDIENDRIIEIAAVTFTFEKNLSSFESLVHVDVPISEESKAIHHISEDMLKNSPKIDAILPSFLEFIDSYIIMGHGIEFDLNLIFQESKRYHIPCSFFSRPYIDTLRLARLYGESPTNSLEMLRKHFNIPFEGAHRAMSDVLVNIEVFKRLSESFSTTESLLERLKKPILLKNMPLGKHKGRKFSDLPLDYLLWAAQQDFDMDLTFSLRTELKKRKKEKTFQQASNPFSDL